jgi:cytoskeleton protein RodZ
MTDFGGKLRQARERRGVSLRQIAANTKISVAALEALERNDLARLPGGIFSRAFVRSYAVEVGLDPDETVREFLERVEEERPAADSSSSRVGETPSDDEGAFESRQRMNVLLKIIVASVLVAAVILYLTWRQTPASSGRPPEPPSPGDLPPVRGASLQTPWIQVSVHL